MPSAATNSTGAVEGGGFSVFPGNSPSPPTPQTWNTWGGGLGGNKVLLAEAGGAGHRHAHILVTEEEAVELVLCMIAWRGSV